MSFTNRKFGVEIECIIDRQYSERTLRQALPRGWQVKYDGSVRGNGNAVEVVSPPISGHAGLDQIKRVCDILRRFGGFVNSTCGLHVHVDTTNLSAADALYVVYRYTKHERQIDGFVARNRRNNYFCMSSRRDGLNNCRNQLTTKHSLAGLVYSRYRKVNLCALSRHGTIEFRQHQGTVKYSEISKWVKFCVNFVEVSHEQLVEALRNQCQTSSNSQAA